MARPAARLFRKGLIRDAFPVHYGLCTASCNPLRAVASGGGGTGRGGHEFRGQRMGNLDSVAFAILAVSFLIVTLIGFVSARWRPAEDPMHLNEWGLGGRGFGTFISWFLLGGDLYTAYTFIAVPALVYAIGAAGFYALSYTIMVFPIVFVFAPRLWSVARARGYITPAEFARGRYGSQGLMLAVTVTGILATMPYIALQLVGIESVLTVVGVTGSARRHAGQGPAADHRVRHRRRVHLPGRAARAGADRVRQGRAHLPDRHRRDHLHPGQAGRLGTRLRRLGRAPEDGQPHHWQAVRQPGRAARRRVGLRHAGARLGAGPVHVPARDHRACSPPGSAA